MTVKGESKVKLLKALASLTALVLASVTLAVPASASTRHNSIDHYTVAISVTPTSTPAKQHKSLNVGTSGTVSANGCSTFVLTLSAVNAANSTFWTFNEHVASVCLSRGRVMSAGSLSATGSVTTTGSQNGWSYKGVVSGGVTSTSSSTDVTVKGKFAHCSSSACTSVEPVLSMTVKANGNYSATWSA